MDDDYYTAQRGGLIPVKWTAPEVSIGGNVNMHCWTENPIAYDYWLSKCSE